MVKKLLTVVLCIVAIALLAQGQSSVVTPSGGGGITLNLNTEDWYWGTVNEPTTIGSSQPTGGVGADGEMRVCGFALLYTAKITSLSYSVAAQGAGNFDIGLYNSAKTLVANIGSTAVQSVGIHPGTLAQGVVTLSPGYYYAAYSFSSAATNQMSMVQVPGTLHTSGNGTCGIASGVFSSGLPTSMGTISSAANAGWPYVKVSP